MYQALLRLGGLCFLTVCFFMLFSVQGWAASIAESNQVSQPPLFKVSENSCSATLFFKAVHLPLPGVEDDNHGFIVVDGPNGKKLELRGGPSKGGGVSTWVPGRITASSGDQPTGNPFNCTTTHNWGVVVPYIGPHGKLGTDTAGAVYSPDGNTPNPTKTIKLGAGAQSNVCKLANCLMTMIKTLGGSCKIYTVGTGQLRNSNTVISTALASCGHADPLPANFRAVGWGTLWESP